MRNRFYVYIIRFYVYIISKVMLDHIKVYTSSELIENLKWPQERNEWISPGIGDALISILDVNSLSVLSSVFIPIHLLWSRTTFLML